VMVLCFVLFQSCRVQNFSCRKSVIKRHRDAGAQVAPWIPFVSIAVGYRSAAAARRDSSVDVSSSQSNQRGFRFVEEGMRWEEANRSLWPTSEVHEEFLPARPALLFSRVQTEDNTNRMQRATGMVAEGVPPPPLPGNNYSIFMGLPDDASRKNVIIKGLRPNSGKQTGYGQFPFLKDKRPQRRGLFLISISIITS
jgi:hypothetical protein